MADDLDFGETIRGMAPGQKVFNRYTLNKILGRGGMGVVWLAHDDELERDIAMKFLPEIVALDKQSIRDLKRETRRSLDLTHPHIIRIYDFVQDATSAAISMEFVAGDTLGSLKADTEPGRFEVSEIQDWVKHLCDALDYAHGKAQVVHRDLKPANLMIDAAGDLKIADFGIAASVSDSVSRVSVQAGSSGTPVYMSPQQMMGEPPAITDDIYALGATLYDLLTSKPPFYSGNVMMQVMNKPPEGMAARRQLLETTGAEIPAAWEQTIMACLSKEAEERPKSAGEVWARLNGQPSATAAPVAAPPPPAPVAEPEATPPTAAAPVPSAKSGGGKSVLPLVAALIVFIGLVGGGAYWWFMVESPKREARRVVEMKLEAEEDARIATEIKFDALLMGRDPDTGGAVRPGVTEPHVIEDLEGLTLMPLPAGEFYLGSVGEHAYWSDNAQPGDEPGRDADEGPRTLVTISQPFFIGTTEVTREQWARLMPDRPRGRFSDLGANLPIEGVTWLDAIEFCRRLTESERERGQLPPGYVYMLPTEAQWEYACRAGTTTPYAGDLESMAWFNTNADERVNPVAQKEPNAWGLYDMHGNVWERVWDVYGPYPGGEVSDWKGPDKMEGWRVFRGGSWRDRDRLQRSAYRGRHFIEDRRDNVGFRVALVPADPAMIPLAWEFRERAEQRIEENLIVVSNVLHQYFTGNEETEVTWWKLIAQMGLESEQFTPLLEERYWALSPLKDDQILELESFDGTRYTYDPNDKSFTITRPE